VAKELEMATSFAKRRTQVAEETKQIPRVKKQGFSKFFPAIEEFVFKDNDIQLAGVRSIDTKLLEKVCSLKESSIKSVRISMGTVESGGFDHDGFPDISFAHFIMAIKRSFMGEDDFLVKNTGLGNNAKIKISGQFWILTCSWSDRRGYWDLRGCIAKKFKWVSGNHILLPETTQSL